MLILYVFLCICGVCSASEKKHYPFQNDPIDVVIVTHEKDKETLDLCIKGIRANGNDIGRVIVVSAKRLTDNAEWFDEAQYPFSKADVRFQIGREDEEVAADFFARGGHPVGWYYQQLLKLYAAYVIPDISSNVLVIDSDTVFLKPVTFLTEEHAGLLCINPKKPTKSHYCSHAERMLPSYKRVYPKVNSVNHHMLFQKPILDDLFQEIENHRGMSLWKVFCREVDINRRYGSGSEFELYYNYALNHTKQVQIRPLKRRSSNNLKNMRLYKKKGFILVSFHSYMREKHRPKSPQTSKA